MSEETEIKSGEESENEESNSLGQDDISALIDEMNKEKNSSESKDEAEKSIGDEAKQDPDGLKDDKSEGIDSNDLNQDDISKLLDEVQTEEKSSEAEEKEDKTEHVENDKKDEKSAESDKSEDENTQVPEIINDHVKEKDVEEQAESQKNDEKPVEKEEKLVKEEKESGKGTDEEDKKKENDEENNDSFNGLDSEDEVEIDGEPDVEPNAETDAEKNEIDKENSVVKIKENDEDIESENDNLSGQAVKLKEVKKRPKRKRVKLFISCILCVLFIVVLFGLYTLFKKSEIDNIKSKKSFQPEQIAKPESKSSEDLNVQEIKNGETKDIILNDRIIAKLDEITELKDQLVIKEREIANLIINYKNGISEMEDEILWVKQNNQIDSLNVAIKNKKIEFGMMTIQRRLAYIEKIDPPYRWLNQGIEELLYLKLKIEIDSKVSHVISGIDMDKMIHEIDIITQNYRTGIENLKIDMKNIELAPFELIWERIIDKEKLSEANTQEDNDPVGIKKTAFTTEDKSNRIIWEEICRGNFKRKNEMTTLSIGAAKCLSKWKHADLFINGLSELSPKVARHLLKWEGNWICLNGVKEISPEAAKHLFQWQGNWISLNGLSQISSGILEHLPQWQGKQIELMGLKYQRSMSEKVGLRSLAKWEKSGGKLYIPAQIRQVIKKF